MKAKSPDLDLVQLERTAERLKSIAHPMRIAILDLLQDNEKLSVTEIYQYLKIEQAATSHHLNILKEKGVLSSKRAGKKIFYSVKTKSLNQIIECINKCTIENN
ncbi:MAG: metalloregulator ArsR/SmtB family transcription factor [Bacteroidota bacterium]